MLYSIVCLDDPGTPHARGALYPLHRAFLDEPTRHIVIAGPLLDTDAETRIGSLLIIETNSLEDARAFAHSDPFAINKVWKSIEVREFLKLVEDRAPVAV